MASEIRVNNIKALTGLGTVTVSADGLNVGGIVTATSFSGPIVGDVGIADTIYHVGDTDTRIRFPAADTFTVETAGSEALRVDSNSGVGVADSIFHLEDTNTAIRFPAADTFTVETAGDERLRVNSSGNIGINSTNPAYSLDIVKTNASMRLNSTSTSTFVITSGASNAARIEFGDLANNDTGYIYYDNSNDSMQIATNGSNERLRITSTGGVHFNNAEFIERVNITAGKLSDNLQVSLDNGMVHYFTTTESTTSIPNIVSTAGINTSMATGDTMALTIVLSGAAGGYSTRISIDGTLAGITTYWSGGAAPTEGASGKDVYAYQIVKTGDAAYDVLATLSNFA